MHQLNSNLIPAEATVNDILFFSPNTFRYPHLFCSGRRWRFRGRGSGGFVFSCLLLLLLGHPRFLGLFSLWPSFLYFFLPLVFGQSEPAAPQANKVSVSSPQATRRRSIPVRVFCASLTWLLFILLLKVFLRRIILPLLMKCGSRRATGVSVSKSRAWPFQHKYSCRKCETTTLVQTTFSPAHSRRCRHRH